MIEFILNNELIKTQKAGGSSLLDFIRTHEHLKGTKIGCREGDCGACTVLQGRLNDKHLNYQSIVSCLTPLANAYGTHIVTIEGLNGDALNPAQKSINDHTATQCGFCTPGFVVALTGHLLNGKKGDAKQSVGGNICRCTGYKSIERAAIDVDKIKETLLYGDEIDTMIEKKWLPKYFTYIKNRLTQISSYKPGTGMTMGGGTDLMVQQADTIRHHDIRSTRETTPLEVELLNNKLLIGAGITVNDFFDHSTIQTYLPSMSTYVPLIASAQIRHMGTLAGNIVNASPIGDISILLLALNATLVFNSQRKLKLKDFYLDYKKTDLHHDELITGIEINSKLADYKLNFEKVSKRTYLDIASVNTAFSIKTKNDIIEDIYFSAGGIGPYPKFMAATCEYLKKKTLSLETLYEALEIIQSEISPISDIRGSKEYKRLLIRQLFLQHFLKLFPHIFNETDILQLMRTNNFAE